VSDGLALQRCRACRATWLPTHEACPACLAADWEWTEASGRGRVVASTVFHRAYHPDFEDRLPYSVSLVELAEGPRMLTNVVGAAPEPGAEVVLEMDRSGDEPLARFRLA
jgi:uncharacterized OB-fold protein